MLPTLYLLLSIFIQYCYCGECQVSRVAKNNGFHRNVVTEINLIDVSSAPLSCKVLLIETLPSGMYIDVYEVKHLKSPEVYSAMKFDIEKPKEQSHAQELYVWQMFTMNTSHITTVSVNLPVHLRYHRPNPGGKMVKIFMETPRIFGQCEGSDFMFQRIEGKAAFSPCGARNISKLCEWRELQCHYMNKGVLEFLMPVGNTDHMHLVVVGTMFCCVSATFVLLFVVCCKVKVTKDAVNPKGVCKQSGTTNFPDNDVKKSEIDFENNVMGNDKKSLNNTEDSYENPGSKSKALRKRIDNSKSK